MNKKNKVDPKHLGIPNINFSIYSEDNEREPQFAKQRMERGFDDSELWSLRDTIAKFILPRLKEFNRLDVGYNSAFKKYPHQKRELNKVIRAFELVVRDDGVFLLSDDEMKEYNKGMKLFVKYFLCLWW